MQNYNFIANSVSLFNVQNEREKCVDIFILRERHSNESEWRRFTRLILYRCENSDMYSARESKENGVANNTIMWSLR